jgi:hypothetical protein
MHIILCLIALLLPLEVGATDWTVQPQPSPYPETRYTPVPNGSGGIQYYGTMSGGGYSAYDALVLGQALERQMRQDAAARTPRDTAPPLHIPYPYQRPSSYGDTR